MGKLDPESTGIAIRQATSLFHAQAGHINEGERTVYHSGARTDSYQKDGDLLIPAAPLA